MALPVGGFLCRNQKSQWSPLYLRKRCLVSFTVAYIILACLLAGFFSLSQRYQGIDKSGETWHYFFKYAPTAVLTIFAALWAQVEYWTKSLAPWQAMSRRPVPADKSVLLDYVSLNSLRALPVSLKRGDSAVTLGILGSIFIQVLIVVSTALITSEEVVFQRQKALPTQGFTVARNFSGDNIDTRPFLNIQGVSRTHIYPFGTASNHAFQPFEVPPHYKLAQPLINSTVDVFTPEIDCQIASSSLHDGTGSASVPGCDMTWGSDSQQMNYPYLLMQTNTCEEPANPENVSKAGNTTAGNTTEKGNERFLVCAVNATTIHYSKDEDPFIVNADFGLSGPNPGSGEAYEANPMTCLICRLNYTVSKGMVKLNSSNKQAVDIVTRDDIPTRQIPGLSPWQFAMSVFSSLGLEQIYLGTNNYLFGSALQMVSGGLFDGSNLDRLYDANVLQNLSIEVWKNLGIQVAKLNYLSLDNGTEVEMHFQTLEPRLRVQPTVFIVMEIILCLLSMISLLLAFSLRRQGPLSRDPSTIMGMASVLADSPSFTDLMRGTSSMSINELGRSLAGTSLRTFKTGRQGSQQLTAIEVHRGSTTNVNHVPLRRSQGSEVPARSTSGWNPFILGLKGSILLCIVPLTVIIAILVLLQKSTQYEGIARISGDSPIVQPLSRLIPALVFVGIGLCFDQLNFVIRTLQPYYELRRGCATSEQDFLIKDFQSSLSIECLWRACKRQRRALFASTLAVLCTPFLPIVATGLFSIETETLASRTVFAKTIGWFNETSTPRNSEVPPDSHDPNIINRIMYMGDGFPQWTSSELALARIDVNETDYALNSSHISVQVPALRGVMNCTNHDITGFGKPPGDSNFPATEYLEINMTFPDYCCGEEDITQAFGSDGYGYSLKSCSNGQLNSFWRYESGVIGLLTNTAFKKWLCPTTIGIYAEIDDQHSVQNLSVFTCMPYVESLQVEAVFDYPSFNLSAHNTSQSEITTDSSVKSIESTKSFFSNDSLWSLGSIAFEPGYVPGLMQMNLSTPNPLAFSDAFFQTIFQGIDPIADPHALLGPANTESLFAAMEHTYRIQMAQALNDKIGRRIDAPASAPQPSNGTLTYQDNPSLIQSRTATYIIVALLAMILICAIITLVTFDIKGLVNSSMNTIGAKASLLAESNLIECMATSLSPSLSPEKSAWLTDEKAMHAILSKNVKLRLGWWKREVEDREDREERYGIDMMTQGRSCDSASSTLLEYTSVSRREKD